MSKWECLGCGKFHNQVAHMIALVAECQKGICNHCISAMVQLIAQHERLKRLPEEKALKAVRK